MDKGLIIFIAIGIGIIYFITSFIGEMQHKEDDKYQNISYQYQSVDSIGQEILELTGVDAKTQLNAWNASRLKKEFLDLFPDFSDMKKFVQERVRGDALQTKLLKNIDSVEGQYVSGTFNAEQAKRALDLLK